MINYEASSSSSKDKLVGISRFASGLLLDDLLDRLADQTNEETIELRLPDARRYFDRPKLWLIRGQEFSFDLSHSYAVPGTVIETAKIQQPSLTSPIYNVEVVSDTFVNRRNETFGLLRSNLSQFSNERSALWKVLDPKAYPRYIEHDVTIFFASANASEHDIEIANGVVNDMLNEGLTIDLRAAEEMYR